LPALSAYDREIRATVEQVVRGGPARVTMDDAVAAADLLDADRRSLETGEPVTLG
jgi:predicted dehydrogenase